MAGWRVKAGVGGTLLALFAVILWIAYSGRGATMYAFLHHVPGGDKTGHVALLAILTTTLSWMLSFRSVRLGRVPFYYGALAMFLFITVEECAQMLTPNRTFDLKDLACNYLGIALASGVCWLLAPRGGRPVS